MKGTSNALFVIAAVLATWSFSAIAAETTVPYTFSSGSTAKSSEVNANFDALATGIDEVSSGLGARLSDVEARIASNAPFFAVRKGQAIVGVKGRYLESPAQQLSGFFSTTLSGLPTTCTESYSWSANAVIEGSDQRSYSSSRQYFLLCQVQLSQYAILEISIPRIPETYSNSDSSTSTDYTELQQPEGYTFAPESSRESRRSYLLDLLRYVSIRKQQ